MPLCASLVVRDAEGQIQDTLFTLAFDGFHARVDRRTCTVIIRYASVSCC